MSDEAVHQQPAPKSLILVVEDDDLVAHMLDGQLGPFFRVERCSNARDALTRLQQLPRPEALVLDMNLPCEDFQGLTTIRRFAALPDPVPIVALTGMTYEREDVLAAGAKEYFTKPANINELKEAIAKAIGSSVASQAMKKADALVTGMSAVVQLSEQLDSNEGRFKRKPPSTVEAAQDETVTMTVNRRGR